MSNLNQEMNLYALSSSASAIDQWITVALFSSGQSDKERFHGMAVDEFKKLADKMGFEIVEGSKCERCGDLDETGLNGMCPTCSDDMGVK